MDLYNLLLPIHSITRWLVLLALLAGVIRGYQGYKKHGLFTKTDGVIRSLAVTLTHIQMSIGVVLYVKSPIVGYFLHNFSEAIKTLDISFFGLIHLLLMATAVTIVTTGAAKSKKSNADNDKFKTMFWWFGIALLIILIAVPWPFSPLAQRPFLRGY